MLKLVPVSVIPSAELPSVLQLVALALAYVSVWVSEWATVLQCGSVGTSTSALAQWSGASFGWPAPLKRLVACK